MFNGNFYIKTQSTIEEMYACTHILFDIFVLFSATITIKMATALTKKNNSAVTLTPKLQGQMINCPCLINAWSDLQETKSV